MASTVNSPEVSSFLATGKAFLDPFKARNRCDITVPRGISTTSAICL